MIETQSLQNLCIYLLLPLPGQYAPFVSVYSDVQALALLPLSVQVSKHSCLSALLPPGLHHLVL